MTLRAVLAAASAALLLALVGCGGSSATSEGASASEVEAEDASATAEAPETTTTTEPPVADDATKALAASAVYAAEDLGDGWTEVVAAPAFATEGLGIDDCFVPEGSELAALPLGAVAGGPNFRAPAGDVFVTSWAAVLPDEGAASVWAEKTRAPSYDECQRALLEETSTTSGGEFEVRTVTTDAQRAGLGSDGLVRIAAFDLVNDGVVTSTVVTSTYQAGEVLLHVVVEVAPGDQAVLDAALADEAEARGAALARIQGE